MSAPPCPARRPCGSCPYRRDVPSGVWAEEEYAKLPSYDLPTAEQPTAAFFCHQQDGRLCAGWVAVHDMDEAFSLRLGAVPPEQLAEVRDYATDVPLFATGSEAAEHGMREIDAPSPAARALVDRLRRKRSRAR